jgi:dihydroflavonol-4-reductase
MRVAVIGATGMLGRHTAIATARAGHEVVAVYRDPRLLGQVAGFDHETRQADMDDPGTLRAALVGVDAVINCAAYYPTAARPWREEVATALRQMQNFYDACADLPLGKVVYLGGAIALPRDPGGRPGNESLRYPGQPSNKNPYLQVKWAMDEQAFVEAAKGLPVAVGIPAMTMGEYDIAGSSRLILEMANRTLPGYLSGRRNMIYSGDAGRGMVRVCEDGQPGERYLLTGENLTMEALMGKIAAATGAPMPRAIPLAVAKLVSTWQDFRHRRRGGPAPKLNASAIAVMAMGSFLDGEKAENSLGFKAETSIDDAIRRALGWFRTAGLVKAAS